MLAFTLSGPHGHGHGHGHGYHGGGYGYRGRGPGRGWYPYYNYAPEVVVVQPTNNCQFTIKMPNGTQVVVAGVCPVPITGPVVATIQPLL